MDEHKVDLDDNLMEEILEDANIDEQDAHPADVSWVKEVLADAQHVLLLAVFCFVAMC